MATYGGEGDGAGQVRKKDLNWGVVAIRINDRCDRRAASTSGLDREEDKVKCSAEIVLDTVGLH